MKEYNELINRTINFLIEEKDNYASEISEIATYQDFKDIKLDRLDIAAINEKRAIVYAIYKLIEDLETLKKERYKLYIDYNVKSFYEDKGEY